MAKFNIEVNLDWVGEDESIDEAIKNEIASSIIKTVSEKAIKDIEAKVNEAVSTTVTEKVSAKLDEALQDFLTRPRNITDKYGDVIKSDTTVLDMLKEQCDNFINGDVDKYGNSTTSKYDKYKSRLDYIVEKNITSNMEYSIDKAAKIIQTAMKNYIDEKLKAQIGENIVKILDLENIKI